MEAVIIVISMKLSIAVAVFFAEASAKASKRSLLNLHETGYDHGHLAD